MLRPGGELIVGLVPRESPWGKKYTAVGRHGHPFYTHARFYTVSQVESMLNKAGFTHEGCRSTLFQPPDHVAHPEPPRSECSGTAGFVVFRARA